MNYRFAILALRPVPFFLGAMTLSAGPVWAAEGIIYKAAAPSGDYCHLKFPAIQENTLSSDRPVLKDPRDGDIVDFYGPCDHDPLGKEEVLRQRDNLRRERSRPSD
ncbi:MAG TPA: hypothetical protein VGW77_07610 [Candidatus Binatia bacterium]|nr:hypothetical protein [Candidatus Binatia bacterium]